VNDDAFLHPRPPGDQAAGEAAVAEVSEEIGTGHEAQLPMEVCHARDSSSEAPERQAPG